MANYTRNTLSGVLSPVNSELEKIEVSLQKKLDRAPSVSQPNQLENVLDANSNRIINLAPPESPNDAVRLKDLQESGNSSAIPPQDGQAGEFLKTDGETAFWDVVDKDSLGLGDVDNTSDANKPISAATQSELNKKASYVQTFSGLASLSPSTNDVFVCTERANAEYIVQPSGYVALAGDVTFANGLVGELQINKVCNILHFGAVELTDSTAAIQESINRASLQATAIVGDDARIIYSPVKVYAPAGAYLLSATLKLNKSFVEIVGDGVGSAIFYRVDGTYGNTLEISPVDPTTSRLIGSGVRGVKFDSRVDMTSGSHLYLESVTQYDFKSLFFENGLVSLDIGGIQNCTFSDIFIESGRYYSTLRVGSRFIRVFESTYENTEVFFNSFNWTFTVNATIEIGIDLTEGDGIWFSDGHVLGAQTGLLINGAGAAQCMAMIFNDVWFDGFCDKNITIKGIASGTFKNIEFNSCKFTGASSNWMVIEGGCTVQDVTIDQPKFKNCNGNGIDAIGGTHIMITGLDADDIARAGAANQYAVRVPTGSSVERLQVNGGKIKSGSIDYGIRVIEAGCKALIDNIDFIGVQTEEVDILSSGFTGHVNGCTTDRPAYNDVAVASSAALPVIADVVNITGTTGTLDTLTNAWDGRTVVLRGDSASHTISHNTGNILINGNINLTLNANRGRRLTYSADAGAWYDA